MLSALDHRGPDSRGQHVDDTIALGHTRLQIIDLETGDQPQFNEDGSLCIVYNGEVYNYHELRDELLGLGHTLATASDTEVILHMYEEYGARCLQRLNGMFAFAIWDANAQSLFLARDRLGVKPLVYSHRGNCFMFASEVRSLAISGQVDLEVDEEALRAYMSFGYIPSPLTIYRNVRKLEPGHYMMVTDSVQICSYWSLLDSLDTARAVPPYEEAREKIRHLVTDAVAARQVSDVPLGGLLSSGVDSNIVCGMLQRQTDNRVKTFSIGFPEHRVLDESTDAKRCSAFHGTDHHSVDVTAADLMECIPAVMDRLGEPFSGGGSILPTFIVSRVACEGVTVALSGDGADELFAGYDKYRVVSWSNLYLKMPHVVRHNFVEYLLRNVPAGRGSRYQETARKLQRFTHAAAIQDTATRHFSLMELFPEEDVARFLPSVRQTGVAPQAEVSRLYGDFEARSGNDSGNCSLYTDFAFTLPNDMLTKVDLASMYNSLEVRSPFLDYRLAEYAFTLPWAYKMGAFSRKRVLKDAFRDMLPPTCLNNRKRGFDVPVGEWLEGELNELFWDAVRTRTGPICIDVATVEELLERHVSRRFDHSKQLWAIFALAYWSASNARGVH